MRSMPTPVPSTTARLRLDALPSRPHTHRRPRLEADQRSVDRPTRPSGGASGERTAERPRHLPRVLDGLRVLVVDDDPDTLEVFAVALTACGAEVRTASSAADALGRLGAHPADVVVSDVAMPGGDGYWLVGQIRRQLDARVSAVPVLAVTAYGREHSRTRALASGFTDHLQKPVDPETLCRTVARAAGR